jgi:hypothetical protein
LQSILSSALPRIDAPQNSKHSGTQRTATLFAQQSCRVQALPRRLHPPPGWSLSHCPPPGWIR